MASKSPIEIIANFLNDATKIIFASIVVGFFVSNQISYNIFLGGMVTTIIFLVLAILTATLTKLTKQYD